MPLNEQEIKEQDARIEQKRRERITTAMENLIAEAELKGYVVTITTVPRYPLAMRNYVMVGDVRKRN